jgi:hypothetical protein
VWSSPPGTTTARTTLAAWQHGECPIGDCRHRRQPRDRCRNGGGAGRPRLRRGAGLPPGCGGGGAGGGPGRRGRSTLRGRAGRRDPRGGRRASLRLGGGGRARLRAGLQRGPHRPHRPARRHPGSNRNFGWDVGVGASRLSRPRCCAATRRGSDATTWNGSPRPRRRLSWVRAPARAAWPTSWRSSTSWRSTSDRSSPRAGTRTLNG